MQDFGSELFFFRIGGFGGKKFARVVDDLHDRIFGSVQTLFLFEQGHVFRIAFQSRYARRDLLSLQSGREGNRKQRNK